MVFGYNSVTVVFRKSVTASDGNRPDMIIGIQAPWNLVEGLAKLALAQYPGADRVTVRDNTGLRGEWKTETTDA